MKILAVLSLTLSGLALSAPNPQSVQGAQIRQLQNYFDANGNWNGRTPERDVRWLAGTQLVGNDYRVVDLAATDTQTACARLCVTDLYCAAFTFVAPRCSLKYHGYTQQPDAAAASGLVRGGS